MSNLIKPFLWDKISDVDLTQGQSDAHEQLTASSNEENNSKFVDIVLDKN